MKLFILFLITFLYLPTSFSSVSIRDEIERLREIGWKIYKQEMSLDTLEKQNLALFLGKKIASFFDEHQIHYVLNPQDGTITILPINKSSQELEQLAYDIYETVQTPLFYSSIYLIDHPYSAASYSYTHGLNLPDESILTLQSDHHAILHELDHMKTWSDIKNEQTTFYNGKLIGGPTEPAGSLYFDEMYAYQNDIIRAKKSFKEDWIQLSQKEQEEFLSNSKIWHLFIQSFEDINPQKNLTPLEEKLGLILRKSFHLANHSYPLILAETKMTLLGENEIEFQKHDSEWKDFPSIRYNFNYDGKPATFLFYHHEMPKNLLQFVKNRVFNLIQKAKENYAFSFSLKNDFMMILNEEKTKNKVLMFNRFLL